MSTILVAEDEAMIRIAIRLVLRAQGFEIVEAADGRAAMRVCETTPPDLVLLDLMMPGLTGREVLEQLSPDFKARVPIIVVSASDEPARQAEVFALGAVAFIVKPFRNATMVKTVRHYLQSREAPSEYIPGLRLPESPALS